MNTFRLTQNQIGKNLYLLPIQNGCNIGLTPFGEAVNWECVDDPRHNPDDDITYVHNDTAVLLHDLYDVENHTTEAGTIKYVQVFARAKSELLAPHKDAIYKILLDDSACTDTQKSDSFDLVTTYSQYSYVWNTNPYRGGAAFEWADIDTYQCGIECNSPILSDSQKTLTLRPNAAGTFSQFSTFGDAPNWKCVDEAATDEDATYIYNDVYLAEKIDMYNIPNHTTETGTIENVALFWRGKFVAGGASNNSIGGRIKTHGNYYTKYYMYPPGGAYVTKSETWTNNPNTGVAWTWAEIDALEIGAITNLNAPGEIRVTQIYCVVSYIEGISNPDMRTTQCYMKVNYDETVFCDLNQPEEISQDYAQNIKMLNFWSGNRAVYGLARSKDTTVMLGYEIEDSDCTDACARLKCVEELGKQGDPVTLTGFSYEDYNDEFQILSWGWKKISDKPVHYAWILELERTE